MVLSHVGEDPDNLTTAIRGCPMQEECNDGCASARFRGVATMELVLDEFASKYSSVATVEGAYSLQMMEAFGAQPAAAPMGEEQQQQQEDRKSIPCRFWKAGTC